MEKHMTQLFDLSGRTALVTGSARGIGFALAEGLAVLERHGLDQDTVLAVLMKGAAGSPLLQTIMARVAAGDFTPNFSVALIEKDLSYAIHEGAKVGGSDGQALIAAGDAVEAQPVIVDQGRARMGDRPADHRGARHGAGRGHDGISRSARRYARSGSKGSPRMVK